MSAASQRYPALSLWWHELRRGRRESHTFDDLWQAACAEATARELVGDGLAALARPRLLEAANIIVNAGATFMEVG